MNPSRSAPALLLMILLAVSGAFSMQGSKKAPAPAAKKPVVESTGAEAGVKFNAGNHPDPFLNPHLASKRKSDDPNEEEPRGQAPPGIAGMYIAQVKLLGTVSGDDPPTAVFLGTDQRSYFLQESDRLFDGYVKRINADSVLLVRETKFRSGKIATQEVIKRLRTP